VIRSRLARICAVSILALGVTALAAVPASAKTKTRTFSSGAINAPLADDTINLFPLNAKGKGKVKSAKVAVRISHAFDADLDIYLVSPRAQFVQLSSDNGGTGNDYGSGAADCTGAFTVFDDAAITPINAGPPSAAPPFAGSFKPQQPLSALKGTKLKGGWQLLVSDDDATVVGTLNCWELTLSYKVKK